MPPVQHQQTAIRRLINKNNMRKKTYITICHKRKLIKKKVRKFSAKSHCGNKINEILLSIYTSLHDSIIY